jgi:hypothetical protein
MTKKEILFDITLSLKDVTDRKNDDFKVLRKGLGYCWSIAIVGYTEIGKQYFEKLIKIDDKDIRWIIRENLKKNRLIKLDRVWVETCYLN